MIDQDLDRIIPATRYDQAEKVVEKLENLFEERELMELPYDEFTKSQNYLVVYKALTSWHSSLPTRPNHLQHLQKYAQIFALYVLE